MIICSECKRPFRSEKDLADHLAQLHPIGHQDQAGEFPTWNEMGRWYGLPVDAEGP